MTPLPFIKGFKASAAAITVTYVCVTLCGTDELLGEKEKYKTISEDLDFTFTELAGF